MNSVQHIRSEIEKIGYSAIEEDYVFSDVFAPSGRDETVRLAAFTHKPPSYRNAAFGVVERPQDTAVAITDDYRALGAPLLFVIQGQEVTVWQVHSEVPPTIYRETSLDKISALFSANRIAWSPARIHAAKSLHTLDKPYQLDFVDAGLLPAIEGEIHTKLDRLLTEALSRIVRLRVIRPGERADDQFVFRTVFRLLAAKVLQDRWHSLAHGWNPADIDMVLSKISGYYKLPALPGESTPLKNTAFDEAWGHLRSGINFRNISADDLAFVYENTLVTEETRTHFGTHSTPRAVAEYVVSRLGLRQDNIATAKIYEPFAGAGAFMVAALRHLRDLLPVEMTEIERHDFLVNRIIGDEIDPFAAEVAMLSLILADYPNENGWAVSQIDLFERYRLIERARSANVVLCNPPFEAFTAEERTRYPEVVQRSPFKSVAALDGILNAQPKAIGFVLPEPFITGRQFARQRQRVEAYYKEIELVALPDRIFEASVIRSSLLIAHTPRSRADNNTSLRSTMVSVRDREQFLKTGKATETRARQWPVTGRGLLWLEDLEEIWGYLSGLPALGTIAAVHNGLQWLGGQANAVREHEELGYRPGIHNANAAHAFVLEDPVYLKYTPESLRRSAKYPWSSPKLLANAARISRGPWCFAAAVDHRGLLASQQLFGIWKRETVIDWSLASICALLNSPVAVAYIASHSPPDRIRVGTAQAIPIPSTIPAKLDDMVDQYTALANETPLLFEDAKAERASEILNAIDAAILACYDLPPRLERRLLEYFRGDTRPTVHPWEHWYPEKFAPFIPLSEYVSGQYREAAGNWLSHAVQALPEEEAAALREILS